MTNQHPITPPTELIQEWIQEAAEGLNPRWQEYEQDIASRACVWQFEQVIKAWEQCLGEPGANFKVIRRFGQKLKAMRPTNTGKQLMDINTQIRIQDTPNYWFTVEDMNIDVGCDGFTISYWEPHKEGDKRIEHITMDKDYALRIADAIYKLFKENNND